MLINMGKYPLHSSQKKIFNNPRPSVQTLYQSFFKASYQGIHHGFAFMKDSIKVFIKDWFLAYFLSLKFLFSEFYMTFRSLTALDFIWFWLFSRFFICNGF